ncbi:MAG TPA: transglutaminase N-terminal domain-containing protein, partial [Steroidobacteraceae bacterium]
MSEPVRYQVRHQTVYAYGSEVAHAHHLLHLAPRATETQSCEDFTLELLPQPGEIGTHVDAFGNQVTLLELDRPHDRLQVTARTLVQVLARERPDPAASRPWEQVAEGLAYAPRPIEAPWLEAARFRTQSPFVPIKSVIAKYAAPCFTAGAPLLSAAAALMQKI